MPSKTTSKDKAKQEQFQSQDTTTKEEQPEKPVDVPPDTEAQTSEPQVKPAKAYVASIQIKDAQAPGLASSWYGTWPKLSRESVLLDSTTKETPVAEDKRALTPRPDTSSRRKPLLSPGSSGRSVPLVATITKLNISSEASKEKEPSEDEDSKGIDTSTAMESTNKNDALTGSEAKTCAIQPAKVQPMIDTVTPTSWLSWSRGDKAILPSNIPDPATSTADSIAIDAPVADGKTEPVKNPPSSEIPAITTASVTPNPNESSTQSVTSSWYPRWALGASNKAEPADAVVANPVPSSIGEPQDTLLPDADAVDKRPAADIKRSSWAFWSNFSIQGQNASGQVAVADSASLPAGEPVMVRNEVTAAIAEDKKKRPLSQGDEPARKKQAASISAPPLANKTEEKVKEVQNILLPSFESTYSVLPENTSIWQQIGSWIYASPSSKHPTLLKEPRKIKHALAIGVHGYFPASIVQTVIGKPTGTSIKFAESAAKAIETFTQKHGYSVQTVDKIALEGEGRIDERLDILWKLLLNWIDMIRKADFILVACHSQGVPVAISLVAKLIGFGCVSEARIGICAMAGISRGPFAEYKSRWIGGSAAELFEFSDPTSSVSKAYRNALEIVVKFGVKVVFIGSLDDQLVPLHSSTFTHVDHPNIYRAVFVDGRIHVADFISHLVGFALKLRNLSTSDHGLIRELSNPLAGSLVGGEGHSRIYDDPAVYNLAMDFSLRTSDVTGTFDADEALMPTTINPYILPFAMRGVLEEDIVRKELSEEVIDLLKQFDRWKPSTKVLRDVKYRLEGVRSKL